MTMTVAVMQALHTNIAQSSEPSLSCQQLDDLIAVITIGITALVLSPDVDSQCRRYHIDFANEHVYGKWSLCTDANEYLCNLKQVVVPQLRAGRRDIGRGN
jgi:hypothetical protein